MKDEVRTMEGRTQKRKIRVIDSPFQYRMIAIFLTVVVAGFAVFSAGLYFYYWISYSAGDNLFRESITIHKQVMETRTVVENGVSRNVETATTKEVPGVSRLELILPPLLINNLAIMAFIIVAGIFASQRIAGPIYRMEKDVDRVLAGEKGVRVKIRRKDNFPNLAHKVNELIQRSEKATVTKD
jgi:methyl-accepting chemotaxis protein